MLQGSGDLVTVSLNLGETGEIALTGELRLFRVKVTKHNPRDQAPFDKIVAAIYLIKAENKAVATSDALRKVKKTLPYVDFTEGGCIVKEVKILECRKAGLLFVEKQDNSFTVGVPRLAELP